MEPLWITKPYVLLQPPYAFKIFPLGTMQPNERRNASVRLAFILTAAAYYQNPQGKVWWLGVLLFGALGYLYLTEQSEAFYKESIYATVGTQRALMEEPEIGSEPARAKPLTIAQEREAKVQQQIQDMNKTKQRVKEEVKQLSEDFLDRGRKAEQMVTNVREQPARSALTWSKNESIYSNRSAFTDTNDEYEDLYMGQTSNADKYVMNRAK
jgi:hypothetical protein